MEQKKKPTIDDLLNALKNPVKRDGSKGLANTRETWERIGNQESFEELGLKGSDLTDFLKDWIADNPYNNI